MAESDVAFPMEQSKELKRKKRMKCLAYVAAFVIFQTAIILVFALTVMRIKNPKFRIRSVLVDDLTFNNSSPSFNMKFIAQVTVKNTNFGHYKFENSTVTFAYKGSQVGEALVTKGRARARARSTKKMNVTMDLNSNGVANDSDLGSDLNSGFLTLTSQSILNGKVHLMKVIKKKKSVEMNCTMTVNLAQKLVRDIKCAHQLT
ncbi:Late embryogenesis abundant protein [Theobroma cacao]|nr:Late embryogenesis abundant protein [Theobroma cacao]